MLNTFLKIISIFVLEFQKLSTGKLSIGTTAEKFKFRIWASFIRIFTCFCKKLFHYGDWRLQYLKPVSTVIECTLNVLRSAWECTYTAVQLHRLDIRPGFFWRIFSTFLKKFCGSADFNQVILFYETID